MLKQGMDRLPVESQCGTIITRVPADAAVLESRSLPGALLL